MLASFDTMVNTFTDADELTNFAETWGIQDLSAVRFRLFQIRNPQYGDQFVTERLNNILHTLPSTYQQNEINACVQTLLMDDEIEESTRLSLEDGVWEPFNIQTGSGDDPQPGPSQIPDTPPSQGLEYTVRTKYERTYVKNAAVDRIFQVKIHQQHHGQRLNDVRRGLHEMFNGVLNQARGDLVGNDLGRVVVHHNGLHDPIVVPLQPWDQLNANTIMDTIEKVLNGNQNLSMDESFDIVVGSVDLPKGGIRRRITKPKGKNKPK